MKISLLLCFIVFLLIFSFKSLNSDKIIQNIRNNYTVFNEIEQEFLSGKMVNIKFTYRKKKKHKEIFFYFCPKK